MFKSRKLGTAKVNAIMDRIINEVAQEFYEFCDSSDDTSQSETKFKFKKQEKSKKRKREEEKCNTEPKKLQTKTKKLHRKGSSALFERKRLFAGMESPNRTKTIPISPVYGSPFASGRYSSFASPDFDKQTELRRPNAKSLKCDGVGVEKQLGEEIPHVKRKGLYSNHDLAEFVLKKKCKHKKHKKYVKKDSERRKSKLHRRSKHGSGKPSDVANHTGSSEMMKENSSATPTDKFQYFDPRPPPSPVLLLSAETRTSLDASSGDLKSDHSSKESLMNMYGGNTVDHDPNKYESSSVIAEITKGTESGDTKNTLQAIGAFSDQTEEKLSMADCSSGSANLAKRTQLKSVTKSCLNPSSEPSVSEVVPMPGIVDDAAESISSAPQYGVRTAPTGNEEQENSHSLKNTSTLTSKCDVNQLRSNKSSTRSKKTSRSEHLNSSPQVEDNVAGKKLHLKIQFKYKKKIGENKAIQLSKQSCLAGPVLEINNPKMKSETNLGNEKVPAYLHVLPDTNTNPIPTERLTLGNNYPIGEIGGNNSNDISATTNSIIPVKIQSAPHSIHSEIMYINSDVSQAIEDQDGPADQKPIVILSDIFPMLTTGQRKQLCATEPTSLSLNLNSQTPSFSIDTDPKLKGNVASDVSGDETIQSHPNQVTKSDLPITTVPSNQVQGAESVLGDKNAAALVQDIHSTCQLSSLVSDSSPENMRTRQAAGKLRVKNVGFKTAVESCTSVAEIHKQDLRVVVDTEKKNNLRHRTYKNIIIKKLNGYTEIVIVVEARKHKLRARQTLRAEYNYLDIDSLKELKRAFTNCGKDKKCKCVLLSSVGPIFCSGIDPISLLSQCSAQDEADIILTLKELLETLIRFPKPIMAAVQGSAVGLGASLLLFCDTVYAGERADFSWPHAKQGVTPFGCVSMLLPQIVGGMRAHSLLLEGRVLSASEAKEYGIVSEVFPHDSFRNNLIPLCTNFTTALSTVIATTKNLLVQNRRQALLEVLSAECASLRSCLEEETNRIILENYIAMQLILD